MLFDLMILRATKQRLLKVVKDWCLFLCLCVCCAVLKRTVTVVNCVLCVQCLCCVWCEENCNCCDVVCCVCIVCAVFGVKRTVTVVMLSTVCAMFVLCLVPHQ